MTIRFIHGFDLAGFKEYYKAVRGELGSTEEDLIKEKPERLIVWMEDSQVLGHAIWHASNTERHPDGDRREEMDRRLLEEELGVRGDFVELHEVWLDERHRGRGLGKAFFDHFEGFSRKKGFRYIVYYADHPAALAICRERRYKEAYGVELEGIDGERGTFYVLSKELEQV